MMEPNNKEKILVVGGGGIGGITAAYLKEASYDVTIYDIDEAHVNEIKKNGLTIDGVRGNKHVDIDATTTLTQSYDIVLLSVKSPHTKDALDTISSHLEPTSLVVSLQNGINEELISKTIGEDRTIGCVVGWGATNNGPGHLTQSSKGQFIIGRLNGEIDTDIQEIKKILDHVTDTIISENILGHLWSKLLINCCIATIGVCFAADVKTLVSHQKIIPIMVGLTDELITVAKHADIHLEKFEDVLDMGLFQINDFEDYKRAVAIMKLAGKRHQGIKSSMWQDVEKGRKTEIDYINGYVEQKAEALGIPTPINQALIQLVKDIDQQKKTPSINNVNDFYTEVRIPQQWIAYHYETDPTKALALFNLPSTYKHQYAATFTGLEFIGLCTAFAKAFEKITSSVIGKIFIRKSPWDIIDLVLTKYLEQMGKQFVSNIQKNYQIEENDTIAVTKICSFLLNIQHYNYQIETVNENESIIFIEEDSDPYINAKRTIEVTDQITVQITRELLKTITHIINEDIDFDTEDITKNGKKGYRIHLTKR